jgi:putative tryptophan/tyrosine transport system substrate-binding protein
MRRREFITLLGGAAAAWPLAANAQQGERVRRIGVLLPANADDPEFQARIGAFLQALALLGWTIGRNVRIDTRWATANAPDIRRHAAELAALAPDVILAHGTSTVGPLLQATRTVPIVFPVASDPVGAGFVDSLGRPGGNATGFMNAEYSMSGKWPELLKQIAPGVTRAAVLRDSTLTSGTAQFATIQAVAPSLGVEVSPVNMRNAGEIERGVAAVARSANGGLIVPASGWAFVHRDGQHVEIIFVPVAGAPARRCALEDEGVLLNRSVRSGSSLVATDQRPDLMIVNDALRGKRVMYKRLATGVFRDVGNSYRRRR